jgi:hypothetical protein
MTDLQIEPPEESEQESTFGTIFLRFGATFLSALFGFALIILGYIFAIFLNLDLEEFNTYTAVYFSVSIAIWILIGLFTPFALFQRAFDEFKGITFGRAIVIILVIGTFVILHWYIITIVTELLVSIFGTE